MFKKYLAESQRAVEAPVSGDEFDFQINETLCLECEVLEHDECSFIVGIDGHALHILEELGMLETEDYPVDTNPLVDPSKPFALANPKQIFIGDDHGTGEYAPVGKNPVASNRFKHWHNEQDHARNKGYILRYVGNDPEKAKESGYEGRAPQLGKNLRGEELPDRGLSPAMRAAVELSKKENEPKTNIMAQMRKLAGLGEADVEEAEYQGHSVQLGKPSSGDVKKYKVYVKDPKSGNVKKVNFGDKNMEIKRDNPERRKNFRARHNCSDKKDRTKAGYWSCRMWSNKPVSKIVSEADAHKIQDKSNRLDSGNKMKPEHAAPIKNAVKFPDQNMSSGSLYLNYRFGVALAGAPNYPMPSDNAIAGDPLLASYTDEELDMINAAAKMVGSKGMKRLSNNRSTELPNTNVTSPIPQNSGAKRKKGK